MSKQGTAKIDLNAYQPDLDRLAERLVAEVVPPAPARRLGQGGCPCTACRSKRS